MKIIKEGIKEENICYNKTCVYCKCIMEYTKLDIKYDRDDSYIECPTCKKFLGVGQYTNQYDRSKDC